MQENTNQAIAYNSVVLYLKMLIDTGCAFFTTRFALQALGVIDYGLYAVLGSIISFIAIFNTIMLSTSNRYIAVAIGKGNIVDVNKQFNVNIVIHLSIAILALITAIPIGVWYIPRYVNYEGSQAIPLMVYIISIIGSVLSFVGVPFKGILMAKEKFIVFSMIDAFSHIFKLIMTWLLVSHFNHKLIIYSLTMAVITAIPTFIFILYCNYQYREIVKLRLIRDYSLYKNVFSFSTWVGVGAISVIAKNQGAALVINVFFNTTMNTAMGIATSFSTYINMFARGVIQPMQPQITKSYAAGNTKRTDELLIMSTKYSFLLTLMVSILFLISPEMLLSLWLGKVPPFASMFLVLFVIDNLVQSLNAGISNIIWASGKIILYQILTSTLNVTAIIAGYYVLRRGVAAYFLTVTYICFSVIRFFAIQWTLHYSLQYKNQKLWKYSYIPSLIVVLLFLPVFLIPTYVPCIIRLIISFIYLSTLEWSVGLTYHERHRLLMFVRAKIKNYIKEK